MPERDVDRAEEAVAATDQQRPIRGVRLDFERFHIRATCGPEPRHGLAADDHVGQQRRSTVVLARDQLRHRAQHTTVGRQPRHFVRAAVEQTRAVGDGEPVGGDVEPQHELGLVGLLLASAENAEDLQHIGGQDVDGARVAGVGVRVPDGHDCESGGVHVGGDHAHVLAADREPHAVHGGHVSVGARVDTHGGQRVAEVVRADRD
ncbi:hypothetical protein [Nocardia abscessus]|uniref:hypothetical protein n=1 Tax=Nocardia abscessus TaxID=120957 RepID=UPI002456BEE8|nr:hypothetical protein [Nocardia abscessus]